MLKKKYFKTLDECEVTFEYAKNGAQKVALLGDFNDWQPIAMKKAKKRGSPFRVKVRLPKEGRYQFRYLIDNEVWVNDEGADDYWANEFGESNGMVSTFPEA